MNQKMFLMAAGLMLSLFTTACSDSSSSGGGGTGVNPPVIKKVTKDTYLSGQKFCETYKKITQNEYGKFVQVPMDYSNPKKGELSLYAYTVKPFDPSKPTYIFVDGGPGQNTHGMMPQYLGGSVNEMRFDQRGLGCSAPETWEVYKDSSLYSSLNNIRDMDMIRKAYGIQKWSVYGLSYGTVPATMYGSVYPDSTVSVVLEGVVGRTNLVHMVGYKAEKMNLVLAQLTSAQRDGFSKLVEENSQDTKLIMGIFTDLFYSDIGMRQEVEILNKLIDSSTGAIQRDLIARVRQNMKDHEEKFPYPQQPGMTDENILVIIYCKNLDARNKKGEMLNYDRSVGFYVETVSGQTWDQDCDEAGVSESDEQPYILEDYKITKPVYYFQGSHDGATLAIGAKAHWQVVPQGPSYFLLAQKGGHNPNLTRLKGKSETIRAEEKKLLMKAVTASPITQDDLTMINIFEVFQKWLLYTDPHADSHMEDEFNGIKRVFEF